MFKLVAFDFDGTLVNTLPVIHFCFNETLKHFNFNTADESQIYSLTGLPLKRMFYELTNQDDNYQELMCSKYREIFLEKALSRVTLFPHVADTLDLVRKKAYISIATSRTSQSTNEILRHLNIFEKFNLVLAEDSVINKKPHPEMLIKTMEHFNLKPNDVIIVGDSIYDIQMGKAAKISTCAVTYGANTHDQLSKEKPDFIINDFASLLDIIGN